MRGHMLVDTPALHTQLLGNPEFDWMLKTVPQVSLTFSMADKSDRSRKEITAKCITSPVEKP